MKHYVKFANIITYAAIGTLAGFIGGVCHRIHYWAVNVLDYCEAQVTLWNKE